MPARRSQIVLRDWRLPALAAGAFAFAGLSGGALPWFLFYALAGLVLASWYWTRHLLCNLTCRWDLPSTALTVGETSEVRVRLYNESWLPVPWLEANHQVALGAGSIVCSAISPLGSLVLTLPLTATRRGFSPAGSLDLTLGDSLGVFTGHLHLVSERRLTVYPRALHLSRLPLALPQPYGHVRSRKQAQEDLTSVAEIRPWRTGDSPRRIHWKATAHRGELQVREYDLAATTEVYLVLDLYRHGHQGEGPEASDERAVEVVASLARTILEQGLAVGFLAHGLKRAALPPGRGLRQLRHILESLVTVQADGLLPLGSALAGERQAFSPRSTLVIVTADVNQELAAALVTLRGEGHGLLVVAVRPGGPSPEKWEAGVGALRAEGIPALVVHKAADLLPKPAPQAGVTA